MFIYDMQAYAVLVEELIASLGYGAYKTVRDI